MIRTLLCDDVTFQRGRGQSIADGAVRNRPEKRSTLLVVSVVGCGGLLVMLAIIAMLPDAAARLESGREKRGISCCSNLKQIGVAMRIYATEFDDRLPPPSGRAGLELLQSKSDTVIPQIMICPYSESPDSYHYVGGFKTGEADADMPIVFCSGHRKYTNVLYADGHVTGHMTSDTPRSWPELLRATGMRDADGETSRIPAEYRKLYTDAPR